MNKIDVKEFLASNNKQLEPYFAEILPKAAQERHQLFKAMNYSMLNPGKRLRPALVIAAGYAVGTSFEKLVPAASSVELIHCYSLIHDDLPAMDDDDLRRGKKTCHKQFDEAHAILAGDALQTLAFEILSSEQLNNFSPEIRIKMVQILAQASGGSGMVLGQAQDIAGENQQLTLEELQELHNNKTGALIRAAIMLGALTGDISAQHLELFAKFGQLIGLAFQIQDDILDVTKSDEELGKPSGSDLKLDKTTFPKLLGLEQAQRSAEQTYQQAVDVLTELPYATEQLLCLADYFIHRNY